MSAESQPAINTKILSVVRNYEQGEFHAAEMLLKSTVARFAKDKKYPEVEQLILEVVKTLSTKSHEVINEVSKCDPGGKCYHHTTRFAGTELHRFTERIPDTVDR